MDEAIATLIKKVVAGTGTDPQVIGDVIIGALCRGARTGSWGGGRPSCWLASRLPGPRWP